LKKKEAASDAKDGCISDEGAFGSHEKEICGRVKYLGLILGILARTTQISCKRSKTVIVEPDKDNMSNSCGSAVLWQKANVPVVRGDRGEQRACRDTDNPKCAKGWGRSKRERDMHHLNKCFTYLPFQEDENGEFFRSSSVSSAGNLNGNLNGRPVVTTPSFGSTTDGALK
jgi:hypothetical protein